MKKIVVLVIVLFMISCKSEINVTNQFNEVAENYVKLVLEVGLYDPYFVDAYYGPEEWKPAPLQDQNATIPSDKLLAKVDQINNKLQDINRDGLDGNQNLRHIYLTKQLKAVKGRIELLGVKNSLSTKKHRLYTMLLHRIIPLNILNP